MIRPRREGKTKQCHTLDADRILLQDASISPTSALIEF